MTEKAADAETSRLYCLKVFLVLTENRLKEPCRFVARQNGSEGNLTLLPYLKIAAYAVCHALSFACPRVDTHFMVNRVGATETLASGL